MANKPVSTEPKEYEREKTGKMIPCPGEAHKNPFIDNCAVCMPRWGKIEELKPVDLAATRAAGLDVRCSDLSAAQMPEQDALVRSGAASHVSRSRKVKGATIYYTVLRWT